VIASNLRRHYPRPLLHALVSLLLIANVINLAADLSAMSDDLRLVIGDCGAVYTLPLGILCAAPYAVSEIAGSAASLNDKPSTARLCYGTIAASTLGGASL